MDCWLRAVERNLNLLASVALTRLGFLVAKGLTHFRFGLMGTLEAQEVGVKNGYSLKIKE